MAPEVARGEAQGPAADVWALGCTVIEMATGRAPWSRVDDVVAAVHLIGYTDAVPEALEWLSAEAKDFLAKCLCRDAAERWTAARLLEHPFLDCCGVKAEDVVIAKWVSPKSTLDAALWESDADDEDDLTETPADRIRSLAGPCWALPEWESDEGWIEVCGSRSELSDAAAACEEVKFPTYGEMSDAAAVVVTSSEQTRCGEVLDLPVATTAAETTHTGSIWGDGPGAEVEAAEPFGADLDAGDDDPVHSVGAAGAYAHRQQQDILENFITVNYPIVLDLDSKNSFSWSIRLCLQVEDPSIFS
jgi:mitogen-activated protein kinase kinase kinase 17/18